MKRAVLILASAMLLSGPARAADPPRRENYAEHYAVLADHNIFLRDRSVRSLGNSATSRPAALPEESLILTGVVFEDDGFRAYVEEGSRIQRLGLGDAVGRGRVSEIALDEIEYEQGSQHTWIAVGCNFLGKSVVPASVSYSAGSTTQPTSLPFDPNAPNLPLEQKMRLRRLQGK